MSSEHGTQRALGRLWKEREEREGGESSRERSKRGKRVRKGASCSRNGAFQALEIQVRQGDGAERHRPGEGRDGDSPRGSFRVGCLRTAHRESNLERRATGMRIPPKWKGSCLR